METCPMCNAENEPMGELGNVVHYKCRYCGAMYCDDSKVPDRKRPLFLIAAEIRQDWRKVNFAAKPYLDAMECLNSVTDNYGCDSGVSVVAYFLSNASTWKGETAKRVKTELRGMIK